MRNLFYLLMIFVFASCGVSSVVVNVQRGGPSTGLPTKTEQSDLMQALYGRNGESHQRGQE